MKTQLCLGLIVLWILVQNLPLTKQDHDLLFKGGHVIDGKKKINGVRDVAILGGRITAVAADIEPALY
jgi:hypothetical protein